MGCSPEKERDYSRFARDRRRPGICWPLARVPGNQAEDHEWQSIERLLLEYVGLSDYDFGHLRESIRPYVQWAGADFRWPATAVPRRGWRWPTACRWPADRDARRAIGSARLPGRGRESARRWRHSCWHRHAPARSASCP